MRKILLIMLVLVGFVGSAQVKQTYNQYGGLWNRLSLKWNGAFQLPRTTLSAKDLNVSTPDTGQVYYNPTDSSVYYNTGTGTGWIKFATGDGTNIYNSSGILIGNRTLTGLNHTYTLTFDSLDFYVRRNNIDRIYENATGSYSVSPNGTSQLFAGNGILSMNVNSGTNYLAGNADSFYTPKKAGYVTNINGSLNINSWITKGYVDSVAGASGVNIYNSNGTLTGNRTVTQNSNTLTFNGDNSVANVNINQTGGFGSALYLASSGTYTLFSDNSVGTYGAYLRTANASTNTVLPVLHLERNTTGTAAAEIGVGIRFSNEFSNGTQARTHDINAKLTDVTAGSFQGEFDFLSYDAGLLETFMNIQASGVVRVNDLADTLATKAYARSVGGGGGISAADLPLRVTGSNVSADTSVAYVPSLTTNARTQKIIDSLSAAGWGYNLYSEPWYTLIDEMTVAIYNGFNLVSSGTGSGATLGNVTGIVNWIGTCSFSTGTTNAGAGFWAASNGGVNAAVVIDGNMRINYGAKIRIEDLPTAGEDFEIVAGMADGSITVSTISNGIYFRLKRADSSDQFILVTESGGTKTEKASGVVAAADTDYVLETSTIGGVVYYYISTGTGAPVFVGSISTNIPSTGINPGGSILKTAGTTSRNLYLDKAMFGVKRN